MTRAFLTFFFGVSLVAEALALSPSQNLEIVLPKPMPKPALGQIIPSDRNFPWNPGMMSKGGIPNRTTICATLSPIGGGTDDSTSIRAAVNSCPNNQVVFLNPGTFTVNNQVLISTPITLRGSGPGITILNKSNGAHARLATVVAGTNGIHTPEGPGATGSFTGSLSGSTLTITAAGSNIMNAGDNISGTGITSGTQIVAQLTGTAGGIGTYSVMPGGQTVASTAISMAYTIDAQPIIQVAPSLFPTHDETSAQALTVDGQEGAYSVTIANASAFAAGQFVILDELSGASWQPVPPGFGCTDSYDGTTTGCTVTPNPPLVWEGDRVVWNMHYPVQHWQDDNSHSDASGPFSTAPGVPPDAMSWFSRTDRPTNEIKEIASVSGNTLTFTSPISITYRVSHTAQITGYSTTYLSRNSVQVTNAGVENLSMYGGANGDLRFESAAYSWAKHVEITQWINEGIAIDNAFRIEIRDSYFHTGSWPEPGGQVTPSV